MVVYFREKKKFEIGEGRQLEDAIAKECEKKKNQEDKIVEGWKRGVSRRMAGPQVHGRLVELGGRGRQHRHLANLRGRLEARRERRQPHGRLAEVHGGLANLSGAIAPLSRGARQKRVPALSSSEVAQPFDRAGRKRPPAKFGEAQRKRATT